MRSTSADSSAAGSTIARDSNMCAILHRSTDRVASRWEPSVQQYARIPYPRPTFGVSLNGMTETDGLVNHTVAGLAAPQPMYKALRESTPVFRGPGVVVLSRLSDIEHALKHTELFSSNMDAVDLGNIRPLIPLQVDPPDHAKYRRILDPLFTPREMARREPQVAEMVNEMIDRFADRGECDFHEEFAVPLPCNVFLTLLGLPLEDLDQFLVWKDGVIRPEGAEGYEGRHDASAGVAQQIYDYFERAIDDHIASPRDDVLSAMIDARVAGEPLSREE